MWHPVEPNWPRKVSEGSEAASVIQQCAPSNLPGIMHSIRGQWKHDFPKNDLSQCVIHSCQPSEWISYAQVWILALTSVALYIYQQKDSSLLPLSCTYFRLMLVHVKMIYKLSAKWKPDWCIYDVLYFVFCVQHICVLFARSVMLHTQDAASHCIQR